MVGLHVTQIFSFLTGDHFSGFRRFAERDHENIVPWTTFESGGHFAAHKQPEWLVGDVRESFRDLR